MIIFDNCLIQAPDGTNLSRCGTKKSKWYLDRGLAEVVGHNPTIIRLKFEPEGRECLNDALLLMDKPNTCCVCGTNENLTRHHIIPYCFIRHMKVEWKMDIIKDIFALCVQCHREYEIKSDEKKKGMANDLNMSVHGVKPEVVRKTRYALSAAAALLKHKNKIPELKRMELTKLVCDFLEKDSINQDDLLSLKKYKITDREDYISFSKYIALRVKDYSEFAKEWRTHFVETMSPKFMPEGWRVDRKTEKVWIPRRVLDQVTR